MGYAHDLGNRGAVGPLQHTDDLRLFGAHAYASCLRSRTTLAGRLGRAVEPADPFARAFQMRSRAVLRSVKRWTGVTPGRPFQRRTRRDAGHCVVR
jgi:hypothetical protein